jgi:hypothetical protein
MAQTNGESYRFVGFAGHKAGEYREKHFND